MLIQVLDSTVTGHAGLIYVQLINIDTDEVVDQIEVDAVAGSATYRFSGIEPGNYLVIGGSDMNNNDLICDGGEACGLYPEENQPLVLEIDSSRTDLDFPVSYAYETPASASSVDSAATSRDSYPKVTP